MIASEVKIEKKTVEVYVATNKPSTYFLTEEFARNDVATELVCEKHGRYPKHSYCYSCHEEREQKRSDDRWEKATPETWNGKIPYLYSDLLDEYLTESDLDSALDEYDFDDLRLYHCKEIKFGHIDESYFHDDLAEDVEVPDELVEMIEEFNRKLDGISTNSYEVDYSRKVVL